MSLEPKSEVLVDNEDYQVVLKAYNALKAQSTRVEQDLKLLETYHQQALDDPVLFIDQLFNEKKIHLPIRQHVVRVPNVDFSKYKTKQPKLPQFSNFISPPGSPDSKEGIELKHSISTPPTFSPSMSPISSPSQLFEVKTEGEKSVHEVPTVGAMVRGRVFTERKPPSFNKLWTEEEQRRLENLLIEYPDEEVSAHRWAKIARALGNRTPKQVASRTQKYFIKLQKMGIPVPGKPPSMAVYLNKINNNKPTKKRKTEDGEEDSDDQAPKGPSVEYYVPPPVLMREDRRSKPNAPTPIPQELSSIPAALQDTPEYKELMALLHAQNNGNTASGNERVIPREDLANELHSGYKCDGCEIEPIVGTRWHCTECEELDFCEACYISNMETPVHKSTHRMEQFSMPETTPYYLDSDYKYSYDFGEANYLDPRVV